MGSVASLARGEEGAVDAGRTVFGKVVACFQAFVMVRCMCEGGLATGGLESDQMLLDAVKVLDLLNEVNNEVDCLPHEEFYNASIMEGINLKDEYPKWKSNSGSSILDFPFLLDAATKGDILRIESMITMRRELQDSFFRALFIGVNSPYLHLEVRREAVVRDAISQLASRSPNDLKKQLRVTFVGEEGIDEGGIQKEFFQLIVQDVFNPDHGMFEVNSESRLYWFTREFPEDAQVYEEYNLIGKLLGLALYNNVTLPIPFPLALFKLLLSKNLVVHDLFDLDPALHRGLETLLNLTPPDLDVALDDWTFDVVSRGKSICLLGEQARGTQVTSENRRDFVERYAQFRMVGSVRDAVAALKDGFDAVVGGDALRLLRPRELRELMVGCEELDFVALEKNAQYDGGWDKDSLAVKAFWEVVHSFSEQEKRALLVFATGSDRVPVGGLGKLPFIVVRNGPDSERLPSSHTCYNVLLLNEYSSKEKLESKLRAAVEHARCGFFLL
ncbi:hypothetical protein DFJ73DRAFT_817872 [Zopfochytrium polystomum]|nr:hypothetical protein DFJ73DRAFT_817872 [Zopfochytrium polystomum]